MRRPRVLHAPLNLANDPWSICKALREMGIEANLATVERSPLVATGDFDLTLPGKSAVGRAASKVAFCARALAHYDLIHYAFGHSIFEYVPPQTWLLDLRFASLVRKPMVMTFHGCDARGTATGTCHLCADGCDIAAKQRRLALVAPTCRPALCHHPRPFGRCRRS